MANRIHNPSTVAAPIGSYSHGIEVPPNARWLYISGQVGIGPDGKVGEGIARQAELVWQNILGILASAGMGPADLVKVNTYLTRKEDIAESRAARAKALGDVRPASTLVVISALAAPEYLIEIEAHAAKA
jgi:enamine deaminase RidA (YjgF/YER057c/UK114 family)